jgi:hypothetical protein
MRNPEWKPAQQYVPERLNMRLPDHASITLSDGRISLLSAIAVLRGLALLRVSSGQ